MPTWPELEAARRTTRRRVVIGLAAATASMVTCAGVVALPMLRRGPYPPHPTGLLALDAVGYHVLCAMAAALLPGRVDPDPVVRRVDETLASFDPMMRKLIGSYPTLLEGSGLLAGGRLQPFTELPAEDQRRVLLRWSDSPVLLWRQAALTLRQLIAAHHYGAEEP